MTDSIFNNTLASADWYRTQQLAAEAQRNNSVKDATLGMQDFIRLLVAQLQNQDMLNPMDNTEFISQMATFSTLTAINNMADQTMTSYAVSLLGKEVTAAVINPVNGVLQRVEGVVTGVSLFEGTPKIYIGEHRFDLQSIMTVGKLPDGSSDDDPNAPLLSILGSFPDEDAFYATNATGSVGDAYRIGNDIWAWSATTNSWIIARSVQGNYADEDAFLEAQITGGAGDAYLVGNTVWEWSATIEDWIKGTTVSGAFDTHRALLAANQKGGVGDAYLIGGTEIWAWMDSSKRWEKSATIQGSFNTDVALFTARPIGNAGEAYLVAGDVWIWSTSAKRWVNSGSAGSGV